MSTIHMAALVVHSPSSNCTISITITNHTDTGEHKFRVSGVIINEHTPDVTAGFGVGVELYTHEENMVRRQSQQQQQGESSDQQGQSSNQQQQWDLLQQQSTQVTGQQQQSHEQQEGEQLPQPQPQQKQQQTGVEQQQEEPQQARGHSKWPGAGFFLGLLEAARGDT